MESVDKDVSAFAEHYAEKYRFSRDGLLLSCGLASLLLLASVEIVAEAGFYTFLRIYVCGVALACAVRFHLVGREVSALILLCMAILFNPIFRVELDQRAWQPAWRNCSTTRFMRSGVGANVLECWYGRSRAFHLNAPS